MLGLFGKKKAPEQKVKELPSQEMELERQRKLVNMHKNLEEMKGKIEVYYQKVDQKQAEVKKLIREKKKNEAKRKLQILKTTQEELGKLESMCVILEKTKIQLEVANDTSKLVDVFHPWQTEEIILIFENFYQVRDSMFLLQIARFLSNSAKKI